MTNETTSPIALDLTALPAFDYINLGFETVTANGEYLEFRAVADPINGWNVLVTCPDELMHQIGDLMRAYVGIRQ